MADDWILSPYSPYDVDIIYKQEAASYIEHVENEWKLYQLSKNSWRKVERLASAEYQTKNLKLNVQLGLNDLKPSLKSKIQYKGKTIYLVFDFQE